MMKSANRKHLTKRICEQAEPEAVDLIIWDTKQVGLGFKVTPSGARSFLHKYRSPVGNRPRKPKIGNFGEITLNQAREIVVRHKADIANGIDPFVTRQNRLKAKSLNEYARSYFELSQKASSTIRNEMGFYKQYLEGGLGKEAIDGVEREAIIRWFQTIESKTSANRVLALLSSILSEAERSGLRPLNSNFCSTIKRHPEKARERSLDAVERQKFLEAIDELTAENLINPSAGYIFRLLLHTGARKSEICAIEWCHINFKEGTLLIPKTKTGAKIVYLSEHAKEILNDIPRLDQSDPFVFPGGSEEGYYKGLKKPFKRILRKTGITNLVIHDLRHTMITSGFQAKLPRGLLKKIVSHKSDKSLDRYINPETQYLREGASEISNYIMQTADRESEKSNL